MYLVSETLDNSIAQNFSVMLDKLDIERTQILNTLLHSFTEFNFN